MNNEFQGTTTTIDIVSDVVCPWCFIGKRQLDAALAQWQQPVLIRWLPFFLNPDTPAAGEPYRPFLEQKFGGAAAVEKLWARVSQAGANTGIAFAFEKIALRANTLAAHRLIHRFQQQGSDTQALVERIFSAGFCEGRFIGDPAMLADLAAQCGAGREATLAYLHSDEDAAEVVAQAARIRQLGIDGVPFFIFNGKLALSGAQPPEVLLDALREAQA
ncbi:MAG: DsbA family oxidoreductase [Rhodocyclaceae bacterium]